MSVEDFEPHLMRKLERIMTGNMAELVRLRGEVRMILAQHLLLCDDDEFSAIKAMVMPLIRARHPEGPGS